MSTTAHTLPFAWNWQHSEYPEKINTFQPKTRLEVLIDSMAETTTNNVNTDGNTEII